VKSKSIYWKYVLIKIKYIFLRDSFVCTIRIFIFDSDHAQINSVEKDEGRGQSVDAGSREERWPQQEVLVPPWRGSPVDAGREWQRCQADSECMPRMSSCRKEEKSCL
jgi:hypothetical protein